MTCTPPFFQRSGRPHPEGMWLDAKGDRQEKRDMDSEELFLKEHYRNVPYIILF